MTQPFVRPRPWLCSVALAIAACTGPAPSAPGRTLDGSPAQTVAPVAATSTPAPPRSRSEEVLALTGGRTRAVWIRDLGDGTDILGFGGQVVVMGFDTDARGDERPLVPTPGSYAKPQITPRGDRVVYADRSDGSVRVVDWSGEHDRRLVEGFPLAVWVDPETRVEWVYVGTDERGTDPESYGVVHRHQIDRPETKELVWNKRAVSGDGFQLSRDGRLAGALARWPEAGVLELPNGEWRPLGDGCWTALARDDSHLFWYFDGQHRNLTIVDTDAGEDRRWTVNINSAPGIDGFEVWHPRWGNHPRFLTMTGPYAVGGADNKIRGGGQGVEIHIGRFTPDHARVEAWVTVTTNDAADFYPDVWIDPAAQVPEPTVTATTDATATPAASATPITVDARVATAVPVPTPGDIAPYRHGLLVVEYEVLDVIDGEYAETTLLAAHWVIRDAALLDTASRPRGAVIRMRLEPYSSRPELDGQRLVMDTDRFDLPLFYDVDSLP